MIEHEKIRLETPDPSTGQIYGWQVRQGGPWIPWQGFYTGPLTLSAERIEGICRKLLGYGLDELKHRVDRVLEPAVGEKARWPALILHSTTPELKAFEGDFAALARGASVGDLTTYKETRSVYLAGPRDIAVGRTKTWQAAVAATDIEAVTLPDVDHYYLSHALLRLADDHHDGRRIPALERLVDSLRRSPRVVRLYALEPEMQVFLCWLARVAGLDTLPVEANRPAISAAWNRKAVLHPTPAVATTLDGAGMSPLELLARESGLAELAQTMELEVPSIPGYTLRRGGDRADFVTQLLDAASLLRSRYGLTTGCLKASEAGDGARITPGIELEDRATLERLGREAFPHGDDYVLEAHVTYGRPCLSGHTLPTALSAHIRGGSVAPGATVQFMHGTSWKGNVYLDHESLDLFQVPRDAYTRLRAFTHGFQQAFERRDPGLVLAGIDFAVGTVGGAFGHQPLLGVQDLNVSFTGAECLRVFLDKASYEAPTEGARPYGVTRVYRPRPTADHGAFSAVTSTTAPPGTRCDTIASIPGRWAMVAITGTDPANALENLSVVQGVLEERDLIEP